MKKIKVYLGKVNTLKINDFGLNDANGEILKKKTDNIIQSNKCNQCDFAGHLKTHSVEKSNKCNQCDFVSADQCYA